LYFIEKYYNKVVIEKINPIQYKLNENNHYYHPDFYLPKYNLIVEVKSSYTYESDLDKNLAKIVSAKTTHAYIINSSIYDYIIDAYSKIDWNDEYSWSQQNPNRMNLHKVKYSRSLLTDHNHRKSADL
jgi:hypothetical protein